MLPVLLQTATAETIPDIWSYAAGNPLYTIFLGVFVVLGALLIVIVVFRWYDRSHEHATENAFNNQIIQDMIAHRQEELQLNAAIVRQINAIAAIEEQIAATQSIVNSILAGEGGVRIAVTAKELTQNSGQGGQGAQQK
jgi:hypothetical protein